MAKRKVISSANRGDVLEQAVRTIETAILRTLPAAGHSKLTIETKKIIVVEGVKHEIDVWVHVDPGGGYDTLVVFECKDWKKTVGKNEVIVLSEKLKASGAQHGYLVARKFSRYASAQAKLDRRIELLQFATDIPIWPTLLHIPGIIKDHRRTRVDVRLKPSSRQDKESNPISTAVSVPAVLDGIEYPNLQDHLLTLVNTMIDERLAAEPTRDLPAGDYSYEIERAFHFSSASINGMSIDGFELHISFMIELVRPPIISLFAVEQRGGIYTTEIFRAADQYVSMQYIVPISKSETSEK